MKVQRLSLVMQRVFFQAILLGCFAHLLLQTKKIDARSVLQRRMNSEKIESASEIMRITDSKGLASSYMGPRGTDCIPGELWHQSTPSTAGKRLDNVQETRGPDSWNFEPAGTSNTAESIKGQAHRYIKGDMRPGVGLRPEIGTKPGGNWNHHRTRSRSRSRSNDNLYVITEDDQGLTPEEGFCIGCCTGEAINEFCCPPVPSFSEMSFSFPDLSWIGAALQGGMDQAVGLLTGALPSGSECCEVMAKCCEGCCGLCGEFCDGLANA